MIKILYNHRFELFFTTQLFILFGALFVPSEFHENILLPILFLLNISIGILMVKKRKKTMWFLISLLTIAILAFGNRMVSHSQDDGYILLRLSIYFIFHIIVTWNIIKQVWQEKRVDRTVIIGLMCGYISLGFLAFFMFMTIEIITPGSYTGILLETSNSFEFRADSIMYYAYITLLTIGYGEIIPVTPIAQKAAILVGLIGQFYIAIITAVVIEKYIRYSIQEKYN